MSRCLGAFLLCAVMSSSNQLELLLRGALLLVEIVKTDVPMVFVPSSSQSWFCVFACPGMNSASCAIMQISAVMPKIFVAGHHKMSLKSEIECLELIVLLKSTVFPDHFDIRITVLAQVVTKI